MTITLKTEHLTLRPIVMTDFSGYRSFFSSQRATFIGGPLDEKMAWFYFCHDVALWQLYGHGALQIELTATGECVGSVGSNHGPLFPEKELGWLIYDGHEGKGYATEAACALRDWAFETLGLKTLVSYIDPDNAASIAVAKKLGAVLDGTVGGQDQGDLVYRHTRSSVY
jgi:RimJ/RimL family protein N-acetyltransferase